MATLTNEVTANKKYSRIILVIGVLIPIVVAILLFAPSRFLEASDWVKNLPAINAIINSLTAILLISAVVAVKNEKVQAHRFMMTSAFILGAIFLVSYIIYHASVESTKFGDVDGDGVLSQLELDKIGGMRMVYLIVLLSHIGLSIVVVPFVLFAFYYALTNQIDRHKKVVKFTFPIWLYVSISGVITYLLISPYYAW